MPPPKVSVCIDVYNYADFLPRAIESALDQTLPDIEVIVVDDCSSDASFDIAREFARRDNRVQAERNPSNLGMVRNRNACLERAGGEYVKFVHADDYLCSRDALRKMAARLEANPAASLIACAMQHVNEDGDLRGAGPVWFKDVRYYAGTSVITRCLASQKNLIGGPSATLFRRDRAARGFDERYFHAADMEMWFHLLEQGCFGYVSEPLIAYRWHGRQQTEKDRSTLSQYDDQRAMQATYLDRPYVRLRPWIKDFVRHDAVRQTLRRCAKLKLRREAAGALKGYGERRYFTHFPAYLAWRKLAKFVGESQCDPLPGPPERAKVSRPPLPRGINVAGFLQGQYGIGSSSRAFSRAVAETGLPCAQINIESRNHSNRDTSVERFSAANPYAVNLMTFSFDYARRFYRDRGRAFFEGRRNIAIWYWELERFPAALHGNFDYYDEIWTPTEFCRSAIAAVSPIPVRHITYPLYPQTSTGGDRAGFGIAPDHYVFLFNFDFFSTVARKNPTGLLAAFRRAFSPTEPVTLALKSINSQHDPEARQKVLEAAAGLNVVWIESHLPGERMDALFAAADCYVSLHRSEGLGLGMAQAMAQGKPVIATAYSGNLEYMREDNSLLVAYCPVEIDRDYGPRGQTPVYLQGGVWAEPDLDDAATKMRWAYEHPEEALQLGKRGLSAITTLLDPGKTRREILASVE